MSRFDITGSGDGLKVLVHGVFDMYNSGQVAFLEYASTLELDNDSTHKQNPSVYVSVLNDDQCGTHSNVFTPDERLYMLNSCKYVTEAQICANTIQADIQAVRACINTIASTITDTITNTITNTFDPDST